MTRSSRQARDNFTATLQLAMLNAWTTYNTSHGRVSGVWQGHLASCERRFGLLVDTVLSLTLRSRGENWSVYTDLDDNDRPTAITFEDDEQPVFEVPITWRARSVSIGTRYKINFASRRAGEAMMVALSELAADAYLAPQKSGTSYRPAIRDVQDALPPV